MSPGVLAIGGMLILFALIWQMTLFDAGALFGARRLPEWLVSVFRWITDFGKSGWFLWPLGILLAAIALGAARPMTHFSRLGLAALAARAGFLFVAIGLPSLFATIVKRLIGRGRPFVGGEADPFLYHPFVWQVPYASMPSGHATTAFAVAVAFGALWPRARAVLWTYAVLIAVSRVVLLSHHPSDVTAGALVGALGALYVRNVFASRRRVFAIDACGQVRAMPGLSWRRMKKVARAIRGQ
jgi:undecaprenyl-diphosphatase